MYAGGRRSVRGAPLTSWGFPTVLSGLILYAASALGPAAIGGWLGMAAASCLTAPLVAVMVAAC